MDYYQELGLTSAASPDQIRQAYLALVRLLHPDHQQDESLRHLADLQMKRLNLVYETLTDAEKRRRYDDERSGLAHNRVQAVIVQPPAPAAARSNYAALVWLLLAAAGVTAISWWITGDNAGTWAQERSVERAEQARIEAPPLAQKAPAGEARVAGPRSELLNRLAVLQAELKAVQGERDRAVLQIARQKAEIEMLSAHADAPHPGTPPARVDRLIAQSTAAEPPKPEAHTRSRFAGTWLYSRPKIETRKTAFYPPEYIEAVIVDEAGGLRGRYRARYQISDRAISPDVAFQFEGVAHGASASMPWSAGSGARGEVHLRLISDNSLEVNWAATDLGRHPGLSSGTAVLYRKPEP